MSIFGWFSNVFGSGVDAPPSTEEAFPNNGLDPIPASSLDDFAVNPANGLPMVGGMGGRDIEGNPFGTDFSHDHMTSSGMNEDFSSSTGSSFDDSWSSASSFPD